MMEITTKKETRSLSTRGLSANYKNDIRVFNHWLDGRPVNAATVAAFFEERTATRKPATVRRNKSAIKKALRLALGDGVTLAELAQFRAFFDEIQPPRGSAAATDDKILTPGEIKKLVKMSGRKTGLIIRALFETAARCGELTGIELKNCRAGRREIAIEIYRPKTKTTDTVYMKRELFDEIRAAYKGRRYLFENNGRALSRHTVFTMIKRAGAKIGRPDIHPHTLRHSWGSAALPVLGLAKVSKYLGHSRVDTTARFYLHGRASEEEVTAANALFFAA